MQEKLVDVFEKRRIELENIINSNNLDESTRELMIKMLDFGYDSAFFARTNDMPSIDNPIEASKYVEAYTSIKKLLENMKK
jgi:hypothetical protein